MKKGVASAETTPFLIMLLSCPEKALQQKVTINGKRRKRVR
jgi:hypothetical protein